MEKPKISIVIASYNSGATIRRSLDSIQALNFPEWECIVVDGKSKDNTVSIVDEYSKKDRRYRYISETDKGIYDAFNKGWKNARAEWVYYLGSDDFLEPDGLGQLMSHAEQKDAAILSGGVIVSYQDGGTTYWEGSDGKPSWGCHQGMIIKKEAIKKAGGFDISFKVMGDKHLNVRILQAGNHVEVVPGLTIAHFAMTGSSRTFSRQLIKCRENYQIAKMIGGG